MESVLSPYVKNESVFEKNFCVFGERVIEKQNFFKTPKCLTILEGWHYQ